MTKKVRCMRCGEVKSAAKFAPSHIRRNRASQWVGMCRLCNTESHKERRHRQFPSSLNQAGVPVICGICGEEKEAVEFRWNARTGYKTDCKECEATLLRCSSCKEIKAHECFPLAKKMATGRHSVCKECHRARIVGKYHSDTEYRKYRSAYRRSKAGKESDKRNKKKHADWYREYHRKYTNDQYHNDPVERNKKEARAAINAGVRYGFLARPKECQHPGKYSPKCGGAIEAHHFMGYERENWLKVEWLCVMCHKAADSKQDTTA